MVIFYIFFWRVHEWRQSDISLAMRALRSSLTFSSNNARQIFLLLLHLICILFDLVHASTFNNAMVNPDVFVCLRCNYIYYIAVFPSFARRFISALFPRHGIFQPLLLLALDSSILKGYSILEFHFYSGHYCYNFYIGCITYTETCISL